MFAIGTMCVPDLILALNSTSSVAALPIAVLPSTDRSTPTVKSAANFESNVA